MIYFWADTHFNHAGILKHCSGSRPWRTVREMNAGLTERWNDTVLKENDEVWFLGDFAFKHPEGDDLGPLFWRLRGRKSIVVGNHDERNPPVLKLPWERVEKLVTFRLEGRRAELCHYPLETWKGAHTGALMLHGHSHGSLKRVIPHRYDVGADVFTAGPVSWETILEKAAADTAYRPQDHHAEDHYTLMKMREEMSRL